MHLPDEKVSGVVDLFERGLQFPPKKRIQFFVCPVGLVGAGKSTVMKLLSEHLSLLRLSTDEMRKVLKEHGYDYDRARQLTLRVGENYAREGYRIGVDADCVDPEYRRHIDELAGELNVPVFYVHVNPPEDFILNKLRTFKHTWLFRDGDDAVKNYRARKPLHADLKLPFIYTFDTSRNDLRRQLRECVELIVSRGSMI